MTRGRKRSTKREGRAASRAEKGPALPDGIDEAHVAEKHGIRRHESVIALGILTVIVLAAAVGFFGRPDSARTASGTAGDLEVFGPSLIRNGEFFEMRFRIRATETIGEPVIAVEDAVWEDLTVNTLIPAATDETHEDGRFLFTFAELPAGEEFLFKVDLQINPDFLGANEGRIALLDGEDEITSLEYELGVLP